MIVYVIEKKVEHGSPVTGEDYWYWELDKVGAGIPVAHFYTSRKVAEMDARGRFDDGIEWRILSLSQADLERELLRSMEEE